MSVAICRKRLANGGQLRRRGGEFDRQSFVLFKASGNQFRQANRVQQARRDATGKSSAAALILPRFHEHQT